MRLAPGDSILHADIVESGGFVSCISSNTRAIAFDVEDIPVLKTAGKGVRALDLDADTQLVAAQIVESEDDGVCVRLSDNRELTLSVRRLSRGKRGAKGRLLVRNGHVVEIVEKRV